MGTKEDFAELFSGLENKLELLPVRFELKDFNFMITSQRSMDSIHKKLTRALDGSLPTNLHSNFWADLRVLGLAHRIRDTVSEFGRAVLKQKILLRQNGNN